jgi:hypothetical protein
MRTEVEQKPFFKGCNFGMPDLYGNGREDMFSFVIKLKYVLVVGKFYTDIEKKKTLLYKRVDTTTEGRLLTRHTFRP